MGQRFDDHGELTKRIEIDLEREPTLHRLPRRPTREQRAENNRRSLGWAFVGAAGGAK